MGRLIRTVRGVLGVISGYAVMVLLLTLILEVLLAGVDWGTSSAGTLLAAGILSFGAALAGGFLAAWVAGGYALIVVSIMACLVVVETTALYLTGRLTGPLWFDVVGAINLMAGAVAGGWLHIFAAAKTGGPSLSKAG